APQRRRARGVSGRPGGLGPRAHPKRAPSPCPARPLSPLQAREGARLARGARAGRRSVAEASTAEGGLIRTAQSARMRPCLMKASILSALYVAPGPPAGASIAASGGPSAEKGAIMAIPLTHAQTLQLKKLEDRAKKLEETAAELEAIVRAQFGPERPSLKVVKD